MPTPARQQYLALKAQHPDALLWFRMGDFYELFDDDALVAARELHLTLTSREFGRGERVPMAGVPHHASDAYLARLVSKGHRVAVAEQVSPPGHGLVERVITRVVTAGTAIEPNLLPARANNYLAAVVRGPAGRGGSAPDAYGLAYVDVTTGEFAVAELRGPAAAVSLEGEMSRLAPAECLVPWDQAGALALPGPSTRYDAWRFEPDAARDRLLRQFGVRSLEGFGCAELPLALGAAGAVLAYLEETNPAVLPLLGGLRTYHTDAFMVLDAHTRRNLELTRGARSGTAEGSLLAVLDATRTPMGGRLLRRFLGQPLLDLDAIVARQDAVDALLARAPLRAELLGRLGAMGDLERWTSRALQGVAGARELLALRELLAGVEPLRERLADVPALAAVREALDPCADVADEIGRAVADGEEGRLIRAGYDAARDALVASIAETRRWLTELETAQRTRTGIRTLKVGFNQVFGYYLEVTHAHRARVPDDYVRKQTLSHAERYITPQLKEAEAIILNAEERIAAAERALFAALLGRIGARAAGLLRTADALAHLDVYLALAEVADRNGYVRPEVHAGDVVAIEGGRHPVVEAALGPEQFVANDCALGGDEARIVLLTGPNMAGKSTYLRQAALIVLLAQIGSYVPARRARVGLVDRIFTRIGAQDDLAAGASTFMVEMVETAAILRHATPRSLVVLDEIGRGTSTEDGLAIARAVVEHLHDAVGARALFATHYHELVDLAARLPALRNLHTAVREEHGEVIFLHRVVPGAADRSYGLHVARLAGLPAPVVARAAALLAGSPVRADEQADRAGANGHVRAAPLALAAPLARAARVVAEAPVVPAVSDRLEMRPARETGALAGTAGVAWDTESPAGAAGGAGSPAGAGGDTGLPAGVAGDVGGPAGSAGDTGSPAGSACAIVDSGALAGAAADPSAAAEPSASPRPAVAASMAIPSCDASALAGVSGSPRPAAPSVATTAADPTAERVLRELLALDLCHLTPLEALNRLAALQQRGREAPP